MSGLSLLPKPIFTNVVTSPGLGKTRLLLCWANQASRNEEVQRAFLGNTLLPVAECTFQSESAARNAYELRSMFLHELHYADKHEHYLGVRFPAGGISVKNSDTFGTNLLRASFVEALYERTKSIKVGRMNVSRIDVPKLLLKAFVEVVWPRKSFFDSACGNLRKNIEVPQQSPTYGQVWCSGNLHCVVR